MVAKLTYNTLKDNILNYSNRVGGELELQIPDIVLFALSRIDNDLQTLGQINIITGQFYDPNINFSQNGLKKPNDWRYTLSFGISGINDDNWNQVELRSYDYLKNYQPDDTILGLPKYYSDFGYNYWIVSPTPSQNFKIQISYVAKFGLLDPSNQENWLTKYQPNLLKNACLLESSIFLRDEYNTAIFEKKYIESKTIVNEVDMLRKTDRFDDINKI